MRNHPLLRARPNETVGTSSAPLLWQGNFPLAMPRKGCAIRPRSTPGMENRFHIRTTRKGLAVRHCLQVPEVAQANANEPIALSRTEINPFSQLQGNVR
jgi:hypothetical protein